MGGGAVTARSGLARAGVPDIDVASTVQSTRDRLHGLASAVGRERGAIAGRGDTTAALYLDAASGNLRHAVSLLGRRRRPVADDEVEIVHGKSLIRTRDGRPVSARSCRHEVEERVDAVCVHAVSDLSSCVWIRRTGDAETIGVRGRVIVRRNELWFVDAAGLDAVPTTSGRASLTSDLARSGALAEIAAGPVGALLLSQALADGSWLHLASGARWFIDDAAARTLVGLVSNAGPPQTLESLGGMIDRDLLARVEHLGWRHVPTRSARL